MGVVAGGMALGNEVVAQRRILGTKRISLDPGPRQRDHRDVFALATRTMEK
jgi:hypothetical protein